LPVNAIKESNCRIAAALQNNGYRIPGKKLTLNKSPADLRKEGSSYDLTLAIGILVAKSQIEEINTLKHYIIMGGTLVGWKPNSILPM
jgi:magnesium chelatase family protein